MGSGRNDEPKEMDVERVNVEAQPSGAGVYDNIHHQDREMQDEFHSHSDDEEMEAESDDEDVLPGNIHMPPRPNFGPPFPNQGLNFGPPFPQQAPPHFGQQRPPRQPLVQFPGFPPLGGEPIFGGEGHKLGGKEVAVIGDAQLITHEGG